MANYDVSSTKSFMQAMERLSRSLESIKFGNEIAIPVINLEEPQGKLEITKQVDRLIQEFQPVMDSKSIARPKRFDLKESLTQIGQLEFLESIVNIVKNEPQESVQSSLIDILGFDHFDLVGEIFQNKSYLEQLDLPKFMTRSERDAQVRDNYTKARNEVLSVERKKQKYPHVFSNSHDAGNIISATGKQFALPEGSSREQYSLYEEIIIPASDKKPPGSQKFTPLTELDFLCQGTFKGYKTLNRMQSLVYPVAYHSNENMLVCAPTGAGKTDVALLTILHTIGQYVSEVPEIEVDYDEFKIVYVAPLKALAAEIVGKFASKLKWLGIQVRELTGDMQLTKAELETTQIIVTTPEKWDVVTRKSRDDLLVEKVKLLIVDEVHLLHEERGAVIETLIARTLRQVEASQSMIRIVGLSATLPNYVDVADFLGVNREVGMFFFDSSFRPVPLRQELLGVRRPREDLDKVAYRKLIDALSAGHQVMVFVHSRKDTYKTGEYFAKTAREEAESGLFDCSESPCHSVYQRELSHRTRSRELRDLFPSGIGIHHAGMVRSDRNLAERMFLDGCIRVLCTTATLAWGVNLPAAVVIVKGTQLYDSQRGGFVDLGVSDVMQIFGRAGRPQFGEVGTGILITNKLDHYVSLLLQQHPIESRLSARLVDNLNAEISLGSVTSVDEAVRWLGYTYLAVRMRLNPFAYGIDWRDLEGDPQLVQKRRAMVMEAARKLHTLQMVVFDERTGSLSSKDLGRIASEFYILHETVETFNTVASPHASEADAISIICMAKEFSQVSARSDESVELKKLSDKVPCQVAVLDSSQGKCNVLLQSWVSRATMRESSLVSDSMFVAQNAARISRALFFVGLSRRWGSFAKVMLTVSKCIDKRMWPFEKQSQVSVPTLSVDAEVFPITSHVLRCVTVVTPDFRWDGSAHGEVQHFWVFVEESDRDGLLHYEKVVVPRRQVHLAKQMEFLVPLSDPLPNQVVVTAFSDTWLGPDSSHVISFQHLIRPENETTQTPLLPLQPLPVSCLGSPQAERALGFSYFNPLQTMCFHALYHSTDSVFVGSPTGSGKTVVAELALWSSLPRGKIVYIAPMKALVRERVSDWRNRLGLKLVELTGDSLPDARDVARASIIVTTPEKFDGITRNWKTRHFVQQVSLVIMDEIHLLASDRGPILEMIVSRMRYISKHTSKPVRLLGMSTAVANAFDMASWLGCSDTGVYNFPSSVRPVPLQMYIEGFPDRLAFSPLMKSMNKPAYRAILQHSPTKPVLVFVASRRQTRLTALDLIHLCGSEENPRRFLHTEEEFPDVKDDTLRLSLQFGIALHHAGLVNSDRALSHKLFEEGKVQILVATSTLAWGVNLPAHLVIIKGTQFFDAKIEGYRDMDLTDVLQMMGRAGRPKYDTSGTAIVFTKESKKSFYKHFLNVGFPVESSLHKVLDNHIGAEISSGTIGSRQQAMDFLTWTFLYRRIHHNPTYYGVESQSQEDISNFLSNLIDSTIERLAVSKCVDVVAGKLIPTPYLHVCSYYYLSHMTIRNLVSHVTPLSTFRDCVKWLSEAAEYDELPTRHGEELINLELSQQMRFPASELNKEFIWDPHVKAFLLFQAHFSRVEMPIADYAQDLVSLLDQALRILQAYIDCVAEMGLLGVVLELVRLMWCVKQARWDEQQNLILPGVDSGEWDLEKIGKSSPKQLALLAKGKGNEFLKVAKTLPTCTLSVSQPSKQDLLVELFHDNPPLNDEFKVYTPFYPKAQRETWFIIVCDTDYKELFLLKRVSPQKSHNTISTKCNITVPPQLCGHKVRVLAVSDFMDLRYEKAHEFLN